MQRSAGVADYVGLSGGQLFLQYEGLNPSGRVVLATTRREWASGGKSHSKVTPTTESPAPTAKRISVAEGSSDTMRTRPP